MKCLRCLVIPLSVVALAGCASRESNVPLNSYQSMAVKEPPSPVAPQADYRINPTDELRVDVFGEPELSLRELPVGPSGNVILPLVGSIKAEGRTPQELTRVITAALDRYLRNPQVSVNVTKFTSQKVTVEGAVKTPGVFQTPTPLTLMDAIALGQGLDDDSKASEILVFRRQGDQRYVARFDLGMIQSGSAADPAILPGDVVVVGFSAGRHLFRDSLALLPAAVGIFIALIR